MDTSFKSFRKEIMKNNKQNTDGMRSEYDEALETVRRGLSDRLSKDMENQMGLYSKNTDEIEIKDKAYLRKKKALYREYITNIMYSDKIRVRGYDSKIKGEGKTADDFIDEMVDEFAGYSILAAAFDNPKISDIFVIDWQTIFVEDDGKNRRYEYKFRSPKHYKDFLNNLLLVNGKEINNGEAKIVDFEVYGDRGCATSQAVSPRDYTLTIRKHAEDHIKRDDLLEYGVIDETMSTFFGTTILGECNIIYAGLTGSGKTTTIRALLDYYVSAKNKRMLVCEDTQELFAENEHTVALVSVKADDAKSAVPLQNLIYTSLRIKPKYIIVGEVRAEEAQAAVEAMETGHSTIFTMHGGTPWNIINRLVTKYLMAMPSLGIDVVERIIGSAVDYVCIQDNIPGIGRKCSSITEISYDFDAGRVSTKTICEYDFRTKGFVWRSGISKEKVDKMLRRGIPIEQLEPWMSVEGIDEIINRKNEHIERAQIEIREANKRLMEEHKAS